MPSTFPLAPDRELHVWRIGLHEPPDPPVRAVLSPDEVERAARLRSPVARRRFRGTRTALRSILARYLDADPETLEFEYGPSGKPSLRPDPERGPRTLSFNISHSDDVALCAVTEEARVGVDIEALHDLRAVEALARRHFSPEEWESWQAAGAEKRLAAFFRVWTRKEALLKAAGFGLSRPLDRVDTIDGRLDGEQYWLTDLDPGAGFTGAVACEREPTDLRLWIWKGP